MSNSTIPRSATKEWKERRLEVMKRDGFRCQQCATNGSLEVHHILPVSRGGGDELDNLVTVCESCHDEIHRHESPSGNGRLPLSILGTGDPLCPDSFRNEHMNFTPAQVDIVAAIREIGPCTIDELVDGSGRAKTTVQRHLKWLRIAGHIRWIEDDVYDYDWHEGEREGVDE